MNSTQMTLATAYKITATGWIHSAACPMNARDRRAAEKVARKRLRMALTLAEIINVDNIRKVCGESAYNESVNSIALRRLLERADAAEIAGTF
jgi:hypothetical protein